MDMGSLSTGASLGTSIGGPGWGTAIGAGLGAFGLFGSDEDPTMELFNKQRRELEAIGLPPDLSYEVALKDLREAGQLSPEQEQNIRMNYSSVGNMIENQQGRDAQLEALNLLKQRGRGLGAEERAAFNEMRDQTQRDAEAKRMQIMNQMAARGQGGSGAELLSALNASQQANTRLSQEGDRLASTAAKNALNSISQYGQLGGTLRQDDYTSSLNRAKAQDAMQEFNIRNSLGVQQRNVAANNRAQEQNLSNKQRIMDYNTKMANDEKLRQTQAKRDYWNDRYKQAGGVADTYSAQARYATPDTGMKDFANAMVDYGAAYKKQNGSTMGSDLLNWGKGLFSGGNESSGSYSGGLSRANSMGPRLTK